MKINHAIIHQIITQSQFVVKKEQASLVEMKLAPNEHPITQNIETLCELLEDRIGSTPKGSSQFSDLTGTGVVKEFFSKYQMGQIAFLEFTTCIMEQFQKKTPPTASGGYVAFLDYEIKASHFLFICILKLESGVTIDESMQVVSTTKIDQQKIHEGARINLNQFQIHLGREKTPPNYIHWVKTKDNQHLSKYFQELLEIDTMIDDAKQTTKFKKAIDPYIDEIVERTESIDQEKQSSIKEELKIAIYDYVGERAKQNDPVDFEEVDEVLKSKIHQYQLTQKESFTEYANQQHKDLVNLFKPDGTKIRAWGFVKAVIKDKHQNSILVKIDKAILHNKDYVVVDREKQELTLKQVGTHFFEEV